MGYRPIPLWGSLPGLGKLGDLRAGMGLERRRLFPPPSTLSQAGAKGLAGTTWP